MAVKISDKEIKDDISVSQPVDLDTMETDVGASKTITDFLTITQAVDLDTMETDVSASKTKTDFLTVTGVVDLDQMEIDVAAVSSGGDGDSQHTHTHANLVGAHNLTTDIDHDQLTNFTTAEHFTQAAITIPHTQISDFDAGVTASVTVAANAVHAALTSGNPHQVTSEEIPLGQLGSPTYEHLDDWFNITQSAGIISGGAITDNVGTGTCAVAAGTGIIKTTNDAQGVSVFFDWGVDASVTLTDNSINFIYVDYNSGTPIIDAVVDCLTLDFTTQTIIGRVYRSGTDLTILEIGCLVENEMHRMIQNHYESYFIQRTSGMIITETGTRNLAATAGVYYTSFVRNTTTAKDTSVADTFTEWQSSTGGGYSDWISFGAHTQWDNGQWDDGDGSLQALANNKWGVHWIYVDVLGEIHVLYGQGSYDSLTEARTASSPFLPDYLQQMAVLAARLVFQESDTAATDVSSTFDLRLNYSSAANHNDLGNIQGGAAADYYHLTSAQHTDIIAKAGFISVTQAVDLDTIESGLGTAQTDITNIETKTDFISVTQAVDLDTIESDVLSAKTKTDWISVTQAVDLDTIESGLGTAQTDITNIETKTDWISVTQAVDLDAIETNSDASKVITDWISVTQAVDLDTMESDILSAKTKTDWISVTQAVDLDTIESGLGAAQTDITNIETKTDFVTVTQAVDLDTMESDILSAKTKTDWISVTQAVDLDAIETNSDASKVITDWLTVTQAVDLDTLESDVATLNGHTTFAAEYGTMAIVSNTTAEATLTTAGTFYVIAAFDTSTTSSSNVTLDPTTDNDITINQTGTYEISWDLSFEGSNNTQYNVAIHNGGTIVAPTQARRDITSATTVGACSGSAVVGITSGDTLDLRISSDTASDTAVICRHGNITVKRIA